VQRNQALWTAAWLALIGFVAGCPFDVDDTGADGTVVVLTDAGEVIAYTSDGSSEAWKENLGASSYGDLLVDGGYVFAFAGGSTVVALDGEDGTQVWSEELSGTVRGRLSFAGDTLFAQTADVVVALDADSGSELWTQAYSGLAGSMTTGDGALYCAGDPDVFKLDPDTGGETDSFSPGEAINDIVYSGGNAMLGGRYHVIAVDGGSMTEEWRFELTSSSVSGMDADLGDVYVSTDSQGVFGFESGSDDWFLHELDGLALDPPVYADDTIYVTESYTYLYSLDASSGAENWRWGTSNEPSGGVRVLGGTVYLADGSVLYGIPVNVGVPDWDQSTGDTILDIELL